MSMVVVGEQDSQRRYREIDIDLALLATMLGGGTRTARPVEGVLDLRFVTVEAKWPTYSLTCIVQSAQFEPVEAGTKPPHWTPNFRFET